MKKEEKKIKRKEMKEIRRRKKKEEKERKGGRRKKERKTYQSIPCPLRTLVNASLIAAEWADRSTWDMTWRKKRKEKNEKKRNDWKKSLEILGNNWDFLEIRRIFQDEVRELMMNSWNSWWFLGNERIFFNHRRLGQTNFQKERKNIKRTWKRKEKSFWILGNLNDFLELS